MLDPTLPIMQLDSIFSIDDPNLVNAHVFHMPRPQFVAQVYFKKETPSPSIDNTDNIVRYYLCYKKKKTLPEPLQSV